MANGRDPAGPAEQRALELPASLARFVVQQGYERYDAADHATWRFILLHLMRHLKGRAHPLYLDGLKRSGLVPERIARISDVDERLSEFGWRAVPVSGFLPPRAFQQLQALGVLPIAADIRTPDHIAYTPSPDIVHEAIGHAPLLCDRLYSQYLKRVGNLGSLAFSCPEDHAVHMAIARLSAVKEQTSDADPLVERAEQLLTQALHAQRTDSEATRMSRLYWWTAEYGLIGTPTDYKLYGAGLLSSLAESLHCHSPRTGKRPLGLDCLDVPYDITREQPQLFVVPSFEHLFDVACAAERTLAATQSPLASLGAAWQSRLPAQLELSTGHVLQATVKRFGVFQGSPAWIELSARSSSPTLIPLGLPESVPSHAELVRLAQAQSLLHLRYASGVHVQGTLVAVSGAVHEPVLHWQNVTVQRAGSHGSARAWQQPLFAQLRRAVPADGTEPMAARLDVAPVERTFSPSDRAVRSLYEQALTTWRQRRERDAVPMLRAIHGRLQVAHPDEWLLRWNLLESLLRLGETEHTRELELELEALEERFTLIHPIATGLRSLGRVQAANDGVQEAS